MKWLEIIFGLDLSAHRVLRHIRDIFMFGTAIAVASLIWFQIEHASDARNTALLVARLNNIAICRQSVFLIQTSLGKINDPMQRRQTIVLSQKYINPINDARKVMHLPPCDFRISK